MNNQMTTGNDMMKLCEQIRSLEFVKNELELYLDTHPSCQTALDYYRKTLDALNKDTELYQSLYGPLTAAGTVSTTEWTWVNAPWPWYKGDEDIKDEKREVK